MRSRQQKLAFARKLMTCESRDERQEEEDGNDDAHRMEGISEVSLYERGRDAEKSRIRQTQLRADRNRQKQGHSRTDHSDSHH